MTDLLNINLPKWPQMRVSGDPVTGEQAKDIILRTDSFLTDPFEYAGGNNHGFNKAYRRDAGLDIINQYTYMNDGALSDEERDHKRRLNDLAWEALSEVRTMIGIVETEYVRNNWASCSYIGGPHGWCSPSGKIFYENNIGKWPSVSEVLDDWSKIASAFPFLKLTATLYNGEEYEYGAPPLVSIIVADGAASLSPPIVTETVSSPKPSFDMHAFLYERNEQGLPPSWVKDYADRVRAVVADVLTDDRFAIIK